MRKGGLGVEYLSINGKKSCNIALGFPVEPDVNKMRPGCPIARKLSISGLCALFFSRT